MSPLNLSRRKRVTFALLAMVMSAVLGLLLLAADLFVHHGDGKRKLAEALAPHVLALAER
jgi:hypothetical protein